MPPIPPYPRPSAAAWQRALAAREATLSCTLTAAARVASSASRLDRAIERLNQSDPRIDRQKRRRSAPSRGRVPIRRP